MTSARSSGASPIASICRCSCNPCAPSPAVPSPGSSRRAPATPTSGPPRRQALLQAFDDSGITAVFMDPGQGGFIEGPKNLALALTAFELAWVDAGAATGSLAGCLALSPIHERGTARAARLLHVPLRPRPARRGPQALARRLLPHRAHPLRRRRDRHARRQSAHRRME